MLRVRFQQRAYDDLFGFAIDFGDKIIGSFFAYGNDVEIACGTIDQAAGAARGLDRDVEHGMHGVLTDSRET